MFIILEGYDCCLEILGTQICTDNRRLVQNAWRRNHVQTYVAACLLCVLSRRSYYDESQVKIYIFFVAQILETLLFDNSVKPGQILLNLLIEWKERRPLRSRTQR